MIVILRLGQACLDVDVVRRAIEQLAARHQRGGLREPGGIPIGRDFAPRLIARAGAAIKAIKTGGERNKVCSFFQNRKIQRNDKILTGFDPQNCALKGGNNRKASP